MLSKWTGIPFGVTTHGYDLRNDPIGNARAAKLFLEADLVVTISKFNRNIMVQKFNIPFDKIHIVYCGIDLNRFSFLGDLKRFNQKKLSHVS